MSLLELRGNPATPANVAVALNKLNEDFVVCLNDEPKAMKYFSSLPKSHQNYFSKWIESAKIVETKTKRIARAVNALAKGWDYVEMIKDKDFM